MRWGLVYFTLQTENCSDLGGFSWVTVLSPQPGTRQQPRSERYGSWQKGFAAADLCYSWALKAPGLSTCRMLPISPWAALWPCHGAPGSSWFHWVGAPGWLQLSELLQNSVTILEGCWRMTGSTTCGCHTEWGFNSHFWLNYEYGRIPLHLEMSRGWGRTRRGSVY